MVPNIFQKIRQYILDYMFFPDASVVIPISLWIAATYIYDAFDAFPYMVITASTKRAGKSRLSELISFTCQNPFRVAGATAPSIFHAIEDNRPTIVWDEAETLSSEAGTLIRALLNVGYRKGQMIPRVNGEYPTYCPKLFVLIGEVYDTLRDRSIIITMQRADTKEIKKRFSYEAAKTDGNELGEELKALIAEHLSEIIAAYNEMDIPFLTDRDEEIWRPLFAIAKVLDKESFNALRRIAVDLATEKTAPVKKYGTINLEAEQKRDKEEYSSKVLQDLVIIMKNEPKTSKGISSNEAVERLKGIDIAPWRKYMGVGLDMNSLADLLNVYNIRPILIREGGSNGKDGKVFRGYRKEHILAAAKIAERI